MFESKILTSMTNPIFSAKAFADYCRAREENYKDLIALLTGVFSYDLSLTSPTIRDDIDEYVNNTSKFSPDAWVPLQAGYIRINQLLYAMLKMDLDIGDVIEGTTIDQEYDVDDNIIPVVNGLGDALSSISYTDVVDSMQADLHSLTCLTAAFNAFNTDSISDRLSSFRDYISRTFQNGFTDFSSSAGYMANLLEKCNTIEELAAQVYRASGYEQTTDESSPVVIGQSDLCQYTGASPAGPLDFSSVASATATVIKTGAKVVGGLLLGLAKGAAKLFKATAQKVIEVVADPYDICVLDSGATSYTVDGFFMEHTPSGTYWIADNNPGDAPSWELFQIMDQMWSKESSYLPESFKFDLIFGEVLVEGFRMDRGRKFTSSDFDSYGWAYDRLILKLKPIRRAVLSELMTYLKAQIDGETFLKGTVEEILPILQKIQNTPMIHADVDVTEKELFLSFVDSYVCLYCLIQFAFAESNYRRDWEMYGNDDPETTEMVIFSPFTDGEIQFKPEFDIYGLLPNVTNKHFATLCAYPDQVLNIAFPFTSSLFPAWAGLLMGHHKIDQFLFPFDYGFLPYSKDCVFSAPRFEIKTDHRNQETFNTFMTTAVTIAVIAVVATVALVKVSKVARKAKLQFAGAQRRLENKLAEGKATKADFKAYKKAKRKVKLTSMFSNGMQQSGSASLNNTIMPNDNISTSDIAALIVS